MGAGSYLDLGHPSHRFDPVDKEEPAIVIGDGNPLPVGCYCNVMRGAANLQPFDQLVITSAEHEYSSRAVIGDPSLSTVRCER